MTQLARLVIYKREIKIAYTNPAPPGMVAQYSTDRGDGLRGRESLPVIALAVCNVTMHETSDGADSHSNTVERNEVHGLIVQEREIQLAETKTGFEGYEFSRPPWQKPLSAQVEEFHKRWQIAAPVVPTAPSEQLLRLRLRLITEEFRELLLAAGLPRAAAQVNALDDNELGRFDMVEVADALGDIDYVVEGMRYALGVNGAPLAEEIHRTNMAKLGGKMDSDGKIQKPPGWTPPDIAGELRKQGWQG